MIEESILRAVLDTNVIIAALKSKNSRSPTVELLRRWRNGEFILLYAERLLLEYREKLITRNISPAGRIEFLADLNDFGISVRLTKKQIRPVITDDPDDDIVVACAVVGGATHLVTYDPHILSLGEMYQGVRILNGLHFLYVVRGDSPPPGKV